MNRIYPRKAQDRSQNSFNDKFYSVERKKKELRVNANARPKVHLKDKKSKLIKDWP